jgi:hypothetical protein
VAPAVRPGNWATTAEKAGAPLRTPGAAIIAAATAASTAKPVPHQRIPILR